MNKKDIIDLYNNKIRLISNYNKFYYIESRPKVSDQEYDIISFNILGRKQNPQSNCSQLKKDIYVYSFCLEPEEHQPSGTCNFSRIDSAKLILSSDGCISNIYAINYNVLRIMSGMGGLAYSS